MIPEKFLKQKKNCCDFIIGLTKNRFLTSQTGMYITEVDHLRSSNNLTINTAKLVQLCTSKSQSLHRRRPSVSLAKSKQSIIAILSEIYKLLSTLQLDGKDFTSSSLLRLSSWLDHWLPQPSSVHIIGKFYTAIHEIQKIVFYSQLRSTYQMNDFLYQISTNNANHYKLLIPRRLIGKTI